MIKAHLNLKEHRKNHKDKNKEKTPYTLHIHGQDGIL